MAIMTICHLCVNDMHCSLNVLADKMTTFCTIYVAGYGAFGYKLKFLGEHFVGPRGENRRWGENRKLGHPHHLNPNSHPGQDFYSQLNIAPGQPYKTDDIHVYLSPQHGR